MNEQDVFVVVRLDTNGDAFYDWRLTAATYEQTDFLWRAHVARSYMTTDERAGHTEHGTNEDELTLITMPFVRIAHVQAEEVEGDCGLAREVGR